MEEFNSHVDVETESININFTSMLDSFTFSEVVHRPVHILQRTFDSVLICGLGIEPLFVLPCS